MPGGRRKRGGDRNGRRDKQVRGREKQCSRELERRIATVCFAIYTKDKQIAGVTHETTKVSMICAARNTAITVSLLAV